VVKATVDTPDGNLVSSQVNVTVSGHMLTQQQQQRISQD